MKPIHPPNSSNNLNSNISLKQQESYYIKHLITQLISKKRYLQTIDILIDEIKYSNRPTSFDEEESNTERRVLFFYSQLAYCYLKTNNFYKCRQTLNSLLEEQPNHSTALFLLAYLDLLDDDIEKSIYRYTQLLKIPNAQKKAKKILEYLKKSNNSTEILLKKYLDFFYQHPPQLKPPSILNLKRWLNFKKTLKKKPVKKIPTKNNTDDNKINQKLIKKNIKKYAFLLLLVTPILLIGFLTIKTTTSSEMINLEGFFTTLQQKLFKENNSNLNLTTTNIEPSIQEEIKNQTTWGVAYKTMETAIKNKDMNLAVLTYNRTLFSSNAQLTVLPELLKKDFNILYYFITPPSYQSLKTTSLKELTEIIKKPTLYKEFFLKLKGTLKEKKTLKPSNYNYTYIPLKNTPLRKKIKDTKLSIQIIFSKKPIIKPKQIVEILTRFSQIKKSSNKLQSIILSGISIKSLIKKSTK